MKEKKSEPGSADGVVLETASGGQGEIAARRELHDLAFLRMDRLEARHGEDYEAVAAETGLALDVVEGLDEDLRLLGAAGADDCHLPHEAMVARLPDGAPF